MDTPKESRLNKVQVLEIALGILSEGVIVFDKNLRIKHANAMAATLHGTASQAELAGLSYMDALGEGYFCDEKHAKILPEKHPVRLALAGEHTRERLLQHINEARKRYRWFNVSSVPVLNQQGETEYVVATFRDVSARKLREDKVRFLIESGKILSLTMDFKERLRSKAELAVPSLSDWCAIDLAKEDGSLERAIVVHRDPKKLAFVANLQKELRTGEETVAERVVRTGAPEFYPLITDELIEKSVKDPSHIPLIKSLRLTSMMIIPIVSRGKTLGTLSLAFAESGRVYEQADFQFMQEFCYHLGILLDNARLYDEIKRRDASKDIFLAALSHELRNPLAPIKSSLELLKLDDALTNATKEELAIIEHQFDHMARLLNDLLDVSRFTQAKIRMDKQPLALQPIVENAIRSVEPLIDDAGVSLSYTAPPFPVVVRGDATRLEQAVSNVLNNAVKYTPHGGSIAVSIKQDRDTALIEVRDTGIGLDAEDMPHIFELYFQGKKHDHKSGGLGLGLLLVHEIMQRHGGSVEAHSEGRGKGSVFTLRLRLDAAPVPEQEKRETPSVGTPDVLVVDDNQQAADALVRLLSALGCNAKAEYSGPDALTCLEKNKPDFLFLDIGMPEMDGYEVAKRVCTLGKGDMQLIALTGYGLAEDKERAYAAGFDFHLTKPIGLKELQSVMQEREV